MITLQGCLGDKTRTRNTLTESILFHKYTSVTKKSRAWACGSDSALCAKWWTDRRNLCWGLDKVIGLGSGTRPEVQVTLTRHALKKV